MSNLLYENASSTDASRVNSAFGHFGAFFFLALGLSALMFPYRVQVAALRKYKTFWGLRNPFSGL
jgi:hypothetical protein